MNALLSNAIFAFLLVLLVNHLENLYVFYGEYQGVRIALKHINWQFGKNGSYQDVKAALMQVTTAEEQLDMVARFFEQWLSGRFARAS